MKSRGHWSFCTEIFYFENLPWVYGVWIPSYEIWNMKWSVSLRSNKHVEGISFLQITSAKMIFIWSFKSCIGPCLMSCSLLLSCLCWCIGKILYILLPPIINEWNSMKPAPGMWIFVCIQYKQHGDPRVVKDSTGFLQCDAVSKSFLFYGSQILNPEKHWTKFKCPIFRKATIKLLKFCLVKIKIKKKKKFLFWTGEKCSIRIWATWIEF